MQEGLLSLLQMSKDERRPRQNGRGASAICSVLTDPTTGGVSASLAMLGDLNIGRAKALIGSRGRA